MNWERQSRSLPDRPATNHLPCPKHQTDLVFPSGQVLLCEQFWVMSPKSVIHFKWTGSFKQTVQFDKENQTSQCLSDISIPIFLIKFSQDQKIWTYYYFMTTIGSFVPVFISSKEFLGGKKLTLDQQQTNSHGPKRPSFSIRVSSVLSLSLKSVIQGSFKPIHLIKPSDLIKNQQLLLKTVKLQSVYLFYWALCFSFSCNLTLNTSVLHTGTFFFKLPPHLFAKKTNIVLERLIHSKN